MKKRFDALLVEKSLFESRAKSQLHIMAGEVYVDGFKETKPSKLININSKIEIKLLKDRFVSRAGEKLSKAIEFYKVDVDSKVCLDIGASTGGFTQCLLNNGAKKVYSVDVGYGQLDYNLRINSKIVNLEKQNARYLKKNDIDDEIDLIVMDVSFISITKFSDFFNEFTHENISYVGLIKPQFELQRDKIDKGGIVNNSKFRSDAITSVRDFLKKYFTNVHDTIDSPIKGTKGNQESLIFCSNR
tara:strand:+ start:17256 stop:17987 length:732 start_codon:yes stop_codon:yes gene_type:complete